MVLQPPHFTLGHKARQALFLLGDGNKVEGVGLQGAGLQKIMYERPHGRDLAQQGVAGNFFFAYKGYIAAHQQAVEGGRGDGFIGGGIGQELAQVELVGLYGITREIALRLEVQQESLNKEVHAIILAISGALIGLLALRQDIYKQI